MTYFPDAVSFEIIDADTGNTVASFESADAVMAALRHLLSLDPRAADLELVAFDKTGIAVGTESARRLLVS